MNSIELEERLINFSVLIIDVCDKLPGTKAGNHLAIQLIRSGSSPALNYGEAQSAESKKDFIHKIQIVLKELRETLVCLKICQRAEIIENIQIIEKAIKECDELVSIFVKSAKTAKENL